MSEDLRPPTPTASPKIRADLPEALRPYLELGEPNEFLTLYRGMSTFSQSNISTQVEAVVSLKWLPTPLIHFDVPNIPDGLYFSPDKVSIQLDGDTTALQGYVSSTPTTISGEIWTTSMHGIIWDSVLRPNDGPVTEVSFLLPNFDQPLGRGVRYPNGGFRASRLLLQGSGWIIHLDSSDNGKKVTDYLEANSGFGITQVGRLEKEDHSPFLASEAQEVLSALAWYVSFAAGHWTGPCLATGFDSSGEQVWQIWGTSRTTPFRRRISWLAHNRDDQFEGPFPGFLKLWLDKTWEEVVRLTIHWYVEANAQAGSIEGAIVLTQTAFELLASAILVDREAWLSQKANDKIDASDRIRLLFRWASIPIGIEDELGDLLELSKRCEEFMLNKVPDAASSMTAIRNTITHPTRKNRETFGKHSHEARSDAWILGMRNLELCLLRLFEYRGTYADRISKKWEGLETKVPWS